MSKTLVQSYVYFGGKCQEALAFYREAVGAEIKFMMRFNESPEAVPPRMLATGFEDKTMHSTFSIGETEILASDGCDEGSGVSGFSLAVSVPTEAEVDRIFNGLADGGEVVMPLAKTFWSPRYGMLKARFGISWLSMACAETEEVV